MAWNANGIMMAVGIVLLCVVGSFVLFLAFRKRNESSKRREQDRSDKNLENHFIQTGIGEQTEEDRKKRERYLKELFYLMDISKRMEKERVFVRIFHEIAEPLQYLLGLSEICTKQSEELTESWKDPLIISSVLRRDVIYVWDLALQKHKEELSKEELKEEELKKEELKKEELQDGKYIAEVSEHEDFAAVCKKDEVVCEEAERWSEAEITGMIRKYQTKIAAEEVKIPYQRLVEELGTVWELLHTWKKESGQEKEIIRQAASQTKRILESNGVYPMFYQDGRITDNQNVRARFVRISKERLQYPSLLVWNQDRQAYEQYGAFAGTCEREEG